MYYTQVTQRPSIHAGASFHSDSGMLGSDRNHHLWHLQGYGGFFSVRDGAGVGPFVTQYPTLPKRVLTLKARDKTRWLQHVFFWPD